MAHATTAPEKISRVSVDPAEMASFSRMAADWWDPTGPFKPLHIMNGARLDFIKQTVCEHFGLDADAERPLEGLRVLDIGCGGGLLCEPMVRLGAQASTRWSEISRRPRPMQSKSVSRLIIATARSSKWSL
jgi:2-polyprenyl-6-hydroxyphenyl methylase/3-demethylubiquinone-9 3-methyltransferase